MSGENNQQSYTFHELGQLFERLVTGLENLVSYLAATNALDPPESTESKLPVSKQPSSSKAKATSSTAAKKASKHEEVPTINELIKAMKKFAAIEGKDKMRALLKEFGAKTASEVPFDKVAELIKRCTSGG